MKSKKIILLLFLLNYIFANSAENRTQFVDLKIGTGNTRGSNCVIGPQMPFGSINPSLQTPNGATSGYNAKFSYHGFGQIAKGAIIEFELTDTPSEWGK